MKHKFILFLSLLALAPAILFSVPSYYLPITVTQPDGSSLTIQLHGDEFFNYKTTVDGYLIQEGKDGLFYFASLDNEGQIVRTSVKAQNLEDRNQDLQIFVAELPTVTAYQDIIAATNQQKREAKQAAKAPQADRQKAYPLSGNPHSLVILVNFTDKNFVTPNPKQAFTNLLNQSGYSANGGTGSAKDYFSENSMGVFNPVFDVVGPYTLSNNMAFYGGNDTSGDDKNPRQMVIDACALAAADGVNFTQYDTDNDGFVDNVFIYYAGYNEAEGGPANTIWPHRWALGNYNTKFNGKIVFDYACTSELRGSFGSNMCGIGTFVHEFSHVLGLPDFYATDGSSHHTLYVWDVMDAGPYLNNGRTPPAYSALERFYLGWLTPTLLEVPQDVTLNKLTTSNQAYLISSSNTHNLKATNPNPTEYFLLENRQQSGWDAYLPGKGMMITQVVYNASKWINNTVNNTASAMGVDIIEADGIANTTTLAGDLFPGSTNKTSFYPTLRNGNDLNKPLFNIKESGGMISFKFSELLTPVAKPATEIGPTSFQANWTIVGNAEKYLLDVFQVHVNDTIYLTNYFERDMDLDTTAVITGVYPESPYYYRVKAVQGNIESLYSNTVEVVTAAYSIDMFSPTALEATEVNSNSFTANWDWEDFNFIPESYKLTVFTREVGDALDFDTNGFNGGELPDAWSGEFTYSADAGYYGSGIPAATIATAGEYVQTPMYSCDIKELNFWYRGKSTIGSNFKLHIAASEDGTNWNVFHTISPVATTAKSISLTENEIPANTKAVKFTFVRPSTSGTITIDDIEIGLDSFVDELLPNFTNKDVGLVTNYGVTDLEDEMDYYYYVVAVYDGNESAKSNVIHVQTSPISGLCYITDNGLQIIKQANGLELSIDNAETHELVVYSTTGQKIYATQLRQQAFIPLNSHGIYILQIGNEFVKVLY